MRASWCSSIALILLICMNFSAAHASTLLLAGGHLPLCSSSNAKACSGPAIAGWQQEQYRYESSASKLGVAALAFNEQRNRRVGELLNRAAKLLGNSTHSRDEFVETLLRVAPWSERNADSEVPISAAKVWDGLLDRERDLLLDHFEIVQWRQPGERLKEGVNLRASDHKIAEIYRAFVALSAQRSKKKRPRVLIVTASSRDPFAAVDYYLAAFNQAGADAQWLPLDAALVATRDCTQLIANRLKILGSAARERVYPDLHAQQLSYCQTPEALSRALAEADGVFLNGGDQSLTLRAWFDEQGGNRYWKLLASRLESGEVVLGGTSAGSAVQSARGPRAAMLSGGESSEAWRSGAQAVSPAELGCERAGRCAAGQREDALTFEPSGGLGSFAFGVVDTHFSERGRQWRLARLLLEREIPAGIGIDEATAAIVESAGNQLKQVRVIGKGAVWWLTGVDHQRVAMQPLHDGFAGLPESGGLECAFSTSNPVQLAMDDSSLATQLRSAAFKKRRHLSVTADAKTFDFCRSQQRWVLRSPSPEKN